MTTAVQHRRGTTAEHSTFTGLEGEVTIDTTKDTAVIHDGVLAGGVPLARENLANVTPSGLATITGASTASDDKFFIYDQSATTLKTITRAELNNAMEADALANVTITGGTINGTTIGGTTPAAGTFTNLAYTGTLTGGTGVVNIGSGQVYKDASGNVGIGTSSPEAQLDVSGQTLLGTGIGSSSNLANFTTATPPQLVAGFSIPAVTWTPVSATEAVFTRDGDMFVDILAGNTSNSRLNFSDTDYEFAGWIDYDHADNSMNFRVNSTERLRITSAGNVGIGTSSILGNAKLQIQGTTAALTVSNTQTDVIEIGTSSSSDSIAFGNLSGNTWSENVRITSSGNVGIGTSSPAVKLDVSGQIRASTGILFGTDTAAANALDDYEEGTWTPQISDGGNIANFGGITQGTYTKIGRVVTLTCRATNIDTTGLTPSNEARLTNLPFGTSGSSYWYGSVYWRTPTDTTYIFSFLQGQGSSANFVNSSGQTMIVSDLNSGSSDLFFSTTYEIV